MQTITTASERKCQVCGVVFFGVGVLCDVHRRELAEHQREEARKDDVIERRIWAERAQRRARGRTEFAEAV